MEEDNDDVACFHHQLMPPPHPHSCPPSTFWAMLCLTMAAALHARSTGHYIHYLLNVPPSFELFRSVSAATLLLAATSPRVLLCSCPCAIVSNIQQSVVIAFRMFQRMFAPSTSVHFGVFCCLWLLLLVLSTTSSRSAKLFCTIS